MSRVFLVLLAALAGCSAVPPSPSGTDYADRLIDRAAVPVEPVPVDLRPPVAAAPAPGAASELRGPLPDESILAAPFIADDLAALAVHRSDEVAGARAKLEAARTGYRQAADLDDLAGLYRSYTRDLDIPVGPPRHSRPAAALSPSPNLTALSGEIVTKSVAMAAERLRSVELSVAAAARRVHADAAHRYETLRILREDVRLLEGLLRVTKIRLEGGQADQAGYLALAAELATRRTELSILVAKAPALRARLNRLLARDESAFVHLDLTPAPAGEPLGDEDGRVARARSEAPDVRAALLRAERAAIAVQLAETMTRPRMDIGSSRYERERVGEAGMDRGPVFPDPGRMIMPRADFGVREAQVTEMRARAESLAAAAKEAGRRTGARVRKAQFAVTASRSRLATLDEEVTPFAAQAFRVEKGAYEGNRSGYLDLLSAARRLVRARLDRAGARRDLSYARADLLVAAGFDPRKETD